MLTWRLIAAGAMLTYIGAHGALAAEVSAEHQGLDVLGNLETAPGKSLKADGAVLIIHDTLAHHRVEVISAQQELLRERGINSLAITLSLGLDKRRGMYDCALEQDHRHDDAVDEIDSWVSWLKDKGAVNITLAGHGRGGAQAALYASRKPDKTVKRLALISPLAQTFERADADYNRRHQRSLRQVLAAAEEFVAKDNPEEILEGAGFLDCAAPKVTAGAFSDYYSASPRFFTPNLLQSVKMPVLLITGDQDAGDAEIAAALRDQPARNAVLERIDGADHFFADAFADQLADRLRDFIAKRPPASAAAPSPASPPPN